LAGINTAFLVDAFSFLISGCLISTLPRPRTVPGIASAKEGFWRTMGGGWKFVYERPDLRVLVAAQTIVVIVLGFQGPLFYAFVEEVLGGGPPTFGIFMSCLGVG